MDEARRFLRYVTPGITYGVETTFLVLLLVPYWVWNQARSFKDDTGLAVAFAAFLGSGAVGYLFSVVHHRVHWLADKATWFVAVDHAPLVRGLVGENVLAIQLGQSAQSPKLDGLDISRVKAWAIVTAIWRTREASPRIKAAKQTIDNLADVLHSAGSSRVGALAAIVTAVTIAVGVAARDQRWPQALQWVVASIAGASFVALHWWNYIAIGKSIDRIGYQIISEQMRLESDRITAKAASRDRLPVRIWFQPD